MAALNADTAMPGLNDAFLAVNAKKTLTSLGKALAELSFLCDRHPWYATAPEMETAGNAIYKEHQKTPDKLSADLKELKQQLTAEKTKLYQVHQPLRTDIADLLFAKALILAGILHPLRHVGHPR